MEEFWPFTYQIYTDDRFISSLWSQLSLSTDLVFNEVVADFLDGLYRYVAADPRIHVMAPWEQMVEHAVMLV
jgi:hypothetical protein